ncbi:MAG: T9SS type A sorting domain-containing protein [Muribaculaceae bacterium]|nr:T9SS type A sorting domain-containing protein [Muribaculaceae bacterium]
MKKHLLLLMLLGVAGTALAQDHVQVVTSGSEFNYGLDDVQRIEFTQEGINVVRSDDMGDLYLFSDNLERIVLHPTIETSVQTVKTEPMTLFVARDGSHVSVRGWQGDKAAVSIYALNGQRVLGLTGWTGGDIDISGLPQGVYVIKVGDKSAKFRK